MLTYDNEGREAEVTANRLVHQSCVSPSSSLCIDVVTPRSRPFRVATPSSPLLRPHKTREIATLRSQIVACTAEVAAEHERAASLEERARTAELISENLRRQSAHSAVIPAAIATERERAAECERCARAAGGHEATAVTTEEWEKMMSDAVDSTKAEAAATLRSAKAETEEARASAEDALRREAETARQLSNKVAGEAARFTETQSMWERSLREAEGRVAEAKVGRFCFRACSISCC